MSSTDSCVVNEPRAGPICSAHSSTSGASVLSLALSSAAMLANTGQFSGEELSRAALVEHEQVARRQRRRDRAREQFRPVGRRPVPGRPPARPPRSGPARRSPPCARSSAPPCPALCRCGPTAWRALAQENPLTLAHGAKGSAAPAGDAPAPASSRSPAMPRTWWSAFALASGETLASAVVERPRLRRCALRIRPRLACGSPTPAIGSARLDQRARDRRCSRRARRGRPVQPRGARRRPAVLLRADPAGPASAASSSATRPASRRAAACRTCAEVCVAAGTSLERALRLTIYTTDLGAFAEINDVYAAFFASEPPARAAVGVAALPKGALVEIDAIVACKKPLPLRLRLGCRTRPLGGSGCGRGVAVGCVLARRLDRLGGVQRPAEQAPQRRALFCVQRREHFVLDRFLRVLGALSACSPAGSAARRGAGDRRGRGGGRRSPDPRAR